MTVSISDSETTVCGLEPRADQGEFTEERRRLVEANYDQLYRLYARPLFRYLLRLTLGDQGEAEDYLQETFLRAWRWLQEHTIDPEITRPWLYTVARRIVIDGLRARRVRPAEVVASDLNMPSWPDNDIDRLVQAHALRCAMRSLSPGHRAALIEVFYNDRTAKEAGQVLGIPEGTVKSRVYYAVQALRQATQDIDGEGRGGGSSHSAPANRQPVRRAPAARRAVESGPKPVQGSWHRPAESVAETKAAA